MLLTLSDCGTSHVQLIHTRAVGFVFFVGSSLECDLYLRELRHKQRWPGFPAPASGQLFQALTITEKSCVALWLAPYGSLDLLMSLCGTDPYRLVWKHVYVYVGDADGLDGNILICILDPTYATASNLFRQDKYPHTPRREFLVAIYFSRAASRMHF